MDFGLQWVLSLISMVLLVIYCFHIIDHNVSWWLQILRQTLDSGKSLPFPDGVLINGQGHTTFSGDQGCILHLAKHFCDSLKNKVHSINTSLPTIVPFFFFFASRKNLHVQDIKCGLIDLIQLQDSGPYNEASWGWRISYNSKHLWLTWRTCGSICFCLSNLKSASKGLLHCCIHSVY